MIKRHSDKTLWISAILLIFIILPVNGFTQTNGDIYEKINRNMDIFGRIYKEIALEYVDRINIDRFFEAGIDGMLKTLDPYTVYYNERNQDAIDLITSGKYGGIGVTISIKDSIVIITDIMSGYEASRKGLRNGDIIRMLDGEDIKGMKAEDIRKRVRGKAGTQIRMTIERDGSLIDFDLTRQEIILKNVSYSGYLGDPSDGIAYIHLQRFSNTSENEIEELLKKFKSQGKINGFILDLRGNGGGLLDAATGILNKLVDKNSLLLTTRGNRKDTEKKYFSKEEPLIPSDVPVAVLINQNTASASEIVAGAIQDLDRGVIIGSRSFGKGLVQQIKDLDYGTNLKITNARYFTPSGRWIQEKNYFEENKYGVFMNVESYRQKEFRTLNGRVVYANGGINPDIELSTEPESEIHFALLMKDMFFKYANYFIENNPALKIFRAGDSDFADFKQFIKSSGFVYNSDADRKLAELKKIGEKKEYSDAYYRYLSEIETEIMREEETELDNAKDEILRSIQKEINKRIITEEEQIVAAFDTDIQLQEALKLIKDSGRYNEILSR